MPAPRTVAVVVLAALAVAAPAAQACRGRAQPAAQSRPAGPAPSAAPATPAGAWPAPARLSRAAARLQAACALRLFCRLAGSQRLGQAEALLGPGVWPRRQLRAVDGFTFLSARVTKAPNARTLVFCTRVLVHVRAPSPLSNGVTTLFITLGRVGTTPGGWLITAVDSSP